MKEIKQELEYLLKKYKETWDDAWLVNIFESVEKQNNLAVSKDRERIVEMIEKHDWECFEQTRIKKDIINFINNTKTDK